LLAAKKHHAFALKGARQSAHFHVRTFAMTRPVGRLSAVLFSLFASAEPLCRRAHRFLPALAKGLRELQRLLNGSFRWIEFQMLHSKSAESFLHFRVDRPSGGDDDASESATQNNLCNPLDDGPLIEWLEVDWCWERRRPAPALSVGQDNRDDHGSIVPLSP